MSLSRSMIALTAILAVLAAGLLIGLSQWSAYLEREPNTQAQASDNGDPDLATTTDESDTDEAASDDTSNAEPSNGTDDAKGTGSADESSAISTTDEQAAGDESSTPSDGSSDKPPQTESAQPVGQPQPDPTLGDPDAPVTIVEFSEFYCPYCARFVWNTLPQIEEAYVDTGKVRFVFRNLTVHGMAAIEAAVAGECAHDQDAFWEYSHAIFDRVFPNRNPSNSQNLSPNDLRDIAVEVELNADQFDRCYTDFENTMAQCQADYESCQQETNDNDACDSAYVDCLEQDEKFAAVRADRQSLSELINALPPEEQKRAEQIGTPTFFVNGRLLIGAQPFSKFEQVIEEELERASSSP